MDPAHFHQAIAFGLGRAVLWLRHNPWRPHAQAIEHVCTHNTAYDPQCEGSRAPYLYECVALTGAIDHFAAVTAGSLRAAHAYWDANHLFHLARLFAANGNTEARDAIYEKFERNDAEEPFVGATDVVELDGTAGIVRVMDRVGRHLADHPDYWNVRDVVPVREFTPEQAATVRAEAELNPNVRRCLEAAEKPPGPVTDGPRLHLRGLSYAEVRARLTGADARTLLVQGDLTAWGRKASDDDVTQAAADLLELGERDPLLRPYLRIFLRRAFPLDPRRLLELAESSNKAVARDAAVALRRVKHPSLRPVARDLVQRGTCDGHALQLLVNNPGAGDEAVVEQVLDRQPGEDALHDVAHAAVDFFKANPGPDATPSMLKVYERCRCSLARVGAVEVLMARRSVPAWMLEECRFDSYDETRELAEHYAGGAAAREGEAPGPA